MENIDAIQLLWTCQHNFVLQSICRNVLREVCIYLLGCSLRVIPGLYENFLYLHDLEAGTIQEVHLDKDLSYGSKLALLSEKEAICAGNWPPSCKVFHLDFRTGHYKEQPFMHTARCDPGLILYRCYIYVFGGDDLAGRASEKGINLEAKLFYSTAGHSQSIPLREPATIFPLLLEL